MLLNTRQLHPSYAGCTVQRFVVYFHVCDKSGLSCGLLRNMLPYLQTAAMTVNASKNGSMMCLLKLTNALPSIRPCRSNDNGHKGIKLLNAWITQSTEGLHSLLNQTVCKTSHASTTLSSAAIRKLALTVNICTLTRAMYRTLNQAHTTRFTAKATGSHIEGIFWNAGKPSAFTSVRCQRSC